MDRGGRRRGRFGRHLAGVLDVFRYPAWRFALCLGLGILAFLAVILIAAQQPRTGLSFAADGDAVTVVGGVASVSKRVVGIGRGVLPIDAKTIIPEPDMLPDYATVDAMIAEQDRIVEALRRDRVVRIEAAGGTRLISVKEVGGFRYLPGAFWMQVAIGFIGFVISGWVWALGPRKVPNILFGISGVAILLLVGAAAIYSTRELAIPSRLFWALQGLNHIGASAFGAAMSSMFLIYPRRLVPNGVPVLIAGVSAIWTLADLLRIVPSPALGGSLTTAVQMVLIMVAIGWQFLRTRGDPVGRAALRWIGLAVLIGPGLFIGTVAVPAVLGGPPILDQGVAFAFFLVVHVGTAIGLGRERLFAIDDWAMALLFYGSVGATFLVVDLILIFLLGSASEAVAVTGLLLLPLLYLPVRDRLVKRIAGRTELGDVLEEVARVALQPDLDARERLWRAALGHAFAPLQIVHGDPATECAVTDQGRGLVVPGIAGVSTLQLFLARRGSRLFTPADVALASRMADLASQVDRDRQAYERGIDAERMRVSRDLHDDLAARLMTGLALDDPIRLRETIRNALVEVRGIVSATLAAPGPLMDLLADIRIESAERLETAGIALDWPPNVLAGSLNAETCKGLSSALRELTTNVLRHSRARTMRVATWTADDRLHLCVEDDGVARGEISATGNGLNNVEHRLRKVGGTVRFTAEGGFRATLAVPIR